MEATAIQLYVDIVQVALPVAIAFELGNLITATFLRAALGGRLWFGR